MTAIKYICHRCTVLFSVIHSIWFFHYFERQINLCDFVVEVNVWVARSTGRFCSNWQKKLDLKLRGCFPALKSK